MNPLAETQTFLDRYNKDIAPSLKEIDIFIKSNKGYISNKKAADLFNISEDELKNILNEEGYSKITNQNFFKIMSKGKSDVCATFRRALERGLPKYYLPHDVSYIYNIDIEKVLEGCNKVGITKFDKYTLQILFYNIKI